LWEHLLFRVANQSFSFRNPQEHLEIDNRKRTTKQELVALYAAYSLALPEHIKNLENIWVSRKQTPWTKSEWDKFYFAIHQVCGTTSTYGYTNLSKALSELAHVVNQCGRGHIPATADKIISELISKVKAILAIPVIPPAVWRE
jgi:hypothetical protein